jgi:NADH dehydrogenase FAD-containing subunit
LAFERAEKLAALGHAAPEAIQQLLTFVLVGAGTVGVEMASTLAEMSRMALARGFRHIDPRAAQILLYEAASRVLPTYPKPLSAKAERHLESLGIKVYTSTPVTLVDAEGIVAGVNGSLPVQCCGARACVPRLRDNGWGRRRTSPEE